MHTHVTDIATSWPFWRWDIATSCRLCPRAVYRHSPSWPFCRWDTDHVDPAPRSMIYRLGPRRRICRWDTTTLCRLHLTWQWGQNPLLGSKNKLRYSQIRDTVKAEIQSNPRYSQSWDTVKSKIQSNPRYSQSWDTVKSEMPFSWNTEILLTCYTEVLPQSWYRNTKLYSEADILNSVIPKHLTWLSCRDISW